jgi:hypothetical protein
MSAITATGTSLASWINAALRAGMHSIPIPASRMRR